MTLITYRNNIKPMLFGIAIVVVVMLCLFATRTSFGSNLGQSTSLDSNCYSLTSHFLFWMLRYILLFCEFAFFALPVFLGRQFPFCTCVPLGPDKFALCALAVFSKGFKDTCVSFSRFWIFPATYFTRRAQRVRFVIILAKLRSRLNFLALRALFCYDLLRHGFSLIKKLCFEPSRNQLPCGFSSLYHKSGGCQ